MQKYLHNELPFIVSGKLSKIFLNYSFQMLSQSGVRMMKSSSYLIFVYQKMKKLHTKLYLAMKMPSQFNI